MVRQFLPLNGLRAFEASARHLSFTRAAIELCVTQAAVSQQVKGLEKRLGVALFQRLPRGLKITAEGEALLPTVTSSFDQMATTLDRIEAGQVRELLFLGVVGTFAVGWLLPRLAAFQKRHPFIDVRVSTNNNRVDMAAEGLDFAIRFGQGSWHGTDAFRLFEAPLSPLCTPKLAEMLKEPADLMDATLLRSYRADEWSTWFAAAGVSPAAQVNAGIVFDTRVSLPSWIGLTLGVMKDSALVLWLGLIELLRASQILVTRLQEPLTILMICGAIYFLISFPIARFGGYLERRWSPND